MSTVVLGGNGDHDESHEKVLSLMRKWLPPSSNVMPRHHASRSEVAAQLEKARTEAIDNVWEKVKQGQTGLISHAKTDVLADRIAHIRVSLDDGHVFMRADVLDERSTNKDWHETKVFGYDTTDLSQRRFNVALDFWTKQLTSDAAEQF